jgi:uncharacterized Zn finger protein (UPF0148 family)
MKSGELWCASCKKQVIVVEEGEDESRIEFTQINNTRSMLLEKIEGITLQMKSETDFEKLKSLSMILSSLLENLEKTERIIEK